MAETVLLQEQVARFAPQEGIAFEEARFTAFKSGRATYPELHFWQQSQSIVTTQTMARHATFDWASERSRARGQRQGADCMRGGGIGGRAELAELRTKTEGAAPPAQAQHQEQS